MQIRRNKINYWKWLSILLLGVLVGYFTGKVSVPQTPTPKSIRLEINVKKDSILKKDTLYVKRTLPALNERNLMAELKKNKIQHPEIVLAQAKLETGHFTSNVLKTCNNLFGLRKGSRYRQFSHWTESVVAYKNLIQKDRYEGGNYYAFLNRIGYAEDPQYIERLKELV